MVLSYMRRMYAAFGAPFKRDFVGNVCGHPTKLRGMVRHDNTGVDRRMSLQPNAEPDYCLECLGKMTIRCAYCSHLIFVGDPITLYLRPHGYQMPPQSQTFTEGDKELMVGCMQYPCSDTFANLQGYWIPPGTVARVPSPLELSLRTRRPVVMENVGNVYRVY